MTFNIFTQSGKIIRKTKIIDVKYVFDEINRLVCERILDEKGEVKAQYTYTLGAAGERLKVEETDEDSSRTVEYKYDDVYRLISETVTDESGTTVTSYTYDKNSNRLTKTVGEEVTEYSYNELNQLISETGIDYEYDLNGNLISKTELGKSTAYSYNARNRLVRVTAQNGADVNVEEYLYDYAGNRTAKIQEFKTTYYLVDTNGALSQVLAEYDENGTLITSYTRADQLISQERNGVKSYYLYDGFDSVRMLADEEGTVTDTYTYDAFGNLISSTGNTVNDFLYRGEQYDSFTGLYYLRARYMNPSTGTFITMDEYAGTIFEPVSLHKYLYANANPVMYSDPSGYVSLYDLGKACIITSILSGIVTAGVTLLRFFHDDSFSLDDYGGNLALAIIDSFIQGMRNGFIFGGFGYIAAHSVLVSLVMIGLCGYSAWESYSSMNEKIEKGNIGGAKIDSCLGALSIFGAFAFIYRAYNLQLNSKSQNGTICGDISSLTPDEQAAVYELLAKGKNVEIIPKTVQTKTPDFYVNGIKTELKTLNGNSLNTAVTRIQEGFNQNAQHVIVDATKTGLTLSDAISVIDRARGSYYNKTLPGSVEIWTREGTIWG